MTRFTVFLPVRDGFPYVQECVASILAQAYPHFELVVLDNASRDDTVRWVRSVGDPRVRLLTSDRSLSIEESWARILAVPKQEFMTVIGHDDVFDPTFLAIIARLIERHPDASLYQTGGRLISHTGATIRPCKPVPPRESAADYLAARFQWQRDVFGTGYVMRSADYDRLGGIPPFERLLFADDALWLGLARQSWKAADPTEAFGIRIHTGSESAPVPSLWPSILRGLDQFSDFLDEFVRGDEASARVHRELGPAFFLRFHRNIYLYALLEACQQGVTIDPAARARIRASLARRAPAMADRLSRSLAVATLELLNGTLLRAVVNRFWTHAYRLRTRSS